MPWREWIYQYRIPLFALAAACSLLALIAAYLTQEYIIALVPFGFIVALVIFHDARWLFYALLLFLPLSNEVGLSESISMYLPTEPLAILITGVAIVYGMLHYKILTGKVWRHPITILIAVHVIWVLTCTISSTEPLVSLKYFLAKFWFIIPYYFLTYFLVRNETDRRRFFWLLLIPSIGAMAYVFINHATTGFLFDVVNAVCRPFYRNHVNYGVWITAILPLLLLTRTWYEKDTLPRLGINLAIILNLACIYFSYTRGAWVALFTLPAFYLIVKYRFTKVAILTSFVGLSVFIGILLHENKYLHYAPDFVKTIYHEEFSDHMSATFQMQDMSTVERFYRWIAAYKMFTERPVTGFGPGNFVHNYKSYTVYAYSTYISDNEEGSSVHNYFLTMLTEQGIPGLIFFIILVVVIVVYIEKIYHQQETDSGRLYIMALGCCFMVLLVNNFFSDLLEADKLGPLFFMMAALLVREDLHRNSPKNKAVVS